MKLILMIAFLLLFMFKLFSQPTLINVRGLARTTEPASQQQTPLTRVTIDLIKILWAK